jgi:dihydrofolate reductase
MPKVKVSAFSVSLDGFGAGADQSEKDPLGVRGGDLHQWMYKTKMFKLMTGQGGGETGPDHDLAEASMQGLGAWVMGRNMFGPVRGPWPDERWKGWWGDEPPYHYPVYVLTHHARPSLSMKGGTTFHFVTDGLAVAVAAAKAAAGHKDVRIGGGVSVIRQALTAGLVDELHLVFAPVLLGQGESLLWGIDLPALGFKVRRHLSTAEALHVFLER